MPDCAADAAGAVQGTNSNITVLGSTFVNNSATNGGALTLVGGSLSVYDSVFAGNAGSQACLALQQHQQQRLCSSRLSASTGTAAAQGPVCEDSCRQLPTAAASSFQPVQSCTRAISWVALAAWPCCEPR